MQDVINIALGADHNGVSLKNILINHLINNGYNCFDVGCFDSSISVDYVDYAEQVALLLSCDKIDFGILICGTGIGMSIAANKFSNVRAALVHNQISAKKTREHNNSNILCLGSWINNEETNINLVNSWLKEPFAGGRHLRRLEKMFMLPKKSNHSTVLIIALNQEEIKNSTLLALAKTLGNQIIFTLLPSPSNNKSKHNDFATLDTELTQEIFEELSPDVVVIENEKILKEFNLSVPEGIKQIVFSSNLGSLTKG